MVRKVVTRAPTREVGIVNPTWLLDHAIEHESHLERRFIMAALACPVVRDVIHQPFEMTLSDPDSGKVHRYTPDFEIFFRDDTQLVVEVKPENFVGQHATKLKLAEVFLRTEERRFVVVTDAHIDGNGLGARATLLMRYGRFRFSETDASACLNHLNKACNGTASVRALTALGSSEALIWHLVARHECRVSDDLSFDADQVVTTNPVSGGFHDYFLAWFGIATR
ncbi:hypothetical protein D9M72_229620 [compost metagenome]